MYNLNKPHIHNEYELLSYLARKIDSSTALDDSLPADATELMLHCPCHHDETPSLALSVKEDKALIHCFAGCSTEDILKVCGLKMSDLFLYKRNNDGLSSDLNSDPMPAVVDKQHIQPVERIFELKSVFDTDKGMKGFNQRKEWKFELLDDSDLLLIEQRYGFPVKVLKELCDHHVLFKWIDFDGSPCWCVTEGGGNNLNYPFNVAQAVRLDGEMFTSKNGRTSKKKTLPGANVSMLGGFYLVFDKFWRSENPRYAYVICEGITDYLAAWSLIDYFDLKNIMPLAAFGAQVKPSNEIFRHIDQTDNFTLILAFDNDKAGLNARYRWYETLKKVFHIKCIDFPEGIKDLRDIFDLVRNKENPPTPEMLAEVQSYFDFDIDEPPIEPENQPVQEIPLVSTSQTAQSAQPVQEPQSVPVNPPVLVTPPVQATQPVQESTSVDASDNEDILQTEPPPPKETLPTEFPWDSIPKVIANYCQIAGYFHSTRPEWVFIHLLAACGVAVGKKFRIEARPGWIEPPIIWTLTVEDSGRNKSEALKIGVQFLVEKQSHINRKARKEFFDDKAKHDMNRKNSKPVFKLTQFYITSDVTYEGLISNLAKVENDTPAILIKAEELGTFFNNFYTGKKDNTEHWIQCYGGRLEACMRKTEDSQVIPPEHGTICITGGCQPNVFKKYLKRNMFMDNGVTWRFLIAYTPHLDPVELPKNEAEYKYTQTQLKNATDELKQIFDTLLDYKQDTMDMIWEEDLSSLPTSEEFNSMIGVEPISPDNDIDPPEENPPEKSPPEDKTDKLTIIGTDQEGRDEIWEINHDILYNHQNIPAGTRGKALGQIVRIALIFAVMDNSSATIVEVGHFRNAYTLWKWLVQCQQALLGNNETQISLIMKDIEEFIRKQSIHEKYGLPSCTLRDLNRKFHSTRSYKEALRMLIEEGTLSEKMNPRNFSSKLLVLHPPDAPKDTT
ncbi:MAG: DUF3987 domain-containing protein [Verrucomicrobia bacterium]|nr:DUF3987 domain-containing protein [Verrucomicrobiota bacterium]